MSCTESGMESLPTQAATSQTWSITVQIPPSRVTKSAIVRASVELRGPRQSAPTLSRRTRATSIMAQPTSGADGAISSARLEPAQAGIERNLQKLGPRAHSGQQVEAPNLHIATAIKGRAASLRATIKAPSYSFTLLCASERSLLHLHGEPQRMMAPCAAQPST